MLRQDENIFTVFLLVFSSLSYDGMSLCFKRSVGYKIFKYF